MNERERELARPYVGPRRTRFLIGESEGLEPEPSRRDCDDDLGRFPERSAKIRRDVESQLLQRFKINADFMLVVAHR